MLGQGDLDVRHAPLIAIGATHGSGTNALHPRPFVHIGFSDHQLVDIHVFPKRLGSPDDFAHLVRSFMENTMLNGETVRLDAATRLA